MVKGYEIRLKVKGWGSAYASIDKALKHYSRRTSSEHTKKTFLEIVDAFLRTVGSNDPDAYVKNPPKTVQADVQRFLDGMKAKDLSVRYINTSHAFLSSFLKENGFKKGREVDVERYHQPARYRKTSEYIPTNEETWQMVENAGSPKNRAMIACLYTSGLRNSTLRALLYRDVKKELAEGQETLLVPVYPEMKKAVPDACKGSVSYYTFFHPHATKILKTYIAEGERKMKFADDAPLFLGEKVNDQLTHVNLRTLERVVKDAARKAGIEDWRSVHPHCLRKAFQSVLRSEYADGGRMDAKMQEFLMGHILPGSQDTYFDKTKVEEIREEYNRLSFRRASDVTQEDLKTSVWTQLLLAAGFTKDEVAKMDFSALSDEEFHKMLREKLLGTMANNGSKQKVIQMGEVERYIQQGWEYVASISNDKAILKLPS
jgi:integrase